MRVQGYEDGAVGDLPGWVKQIRPHQERAVEDVVGAYEDGADVVILDAPTGSGKTLIAELVRRRLNTRGVYVCSDKGLQDQFAGDFPYAKVLKGRSNYETELYQWPEYSAADCMGGDECGLCDSKMTCPYERAKVDALGARLAVVNTAYLVAEANHAGRFSQLPFVVVDECDMVEQVLMGAIEFRIGPAMLRGLGLTAPKKGSRKGTIAKWLGAEFARGVEGRLRMLDPSAENAKEILRLNRVKKAAREIGGRLADDGESDGNAAEVKWVRDNDAGPLVMKPVMVREFGKDMLWAHGKRWLLMSATVISSEMLGWSLGLDLTEKKVATVSVPMTFAAENRPVYIAPVADMSWKGKASGDWEKMGEVIREVVARHPGEKVLVHTVSYALTETLAKKGARWGQAGVGGGRKVFTYQSAEGKAPALKRWLASKDGVMYAPSLGRGVDLKGDDCRVVIVAKMPYPNLGDVQISTLMHSGREGSMWYAAETVRGIVQMTGRAVRDEEDWAVTYVLDSQFVGNVWKRHQSFFPKWWREAVDTGFNVRALLRDAQEGRQG